MIENDNAATDHLTLTVDIVVAHVSNNGVEAGELPKLITAVHGALTGLNSPKAPELAKQEPAVSIRSSIKPDHIVCLEDGKKLKMLKRYLRTNYDMSPQEYRRKWGLPSDYPMVAPTYAEKRRTLAHSLGLGRKAAARTQAADEPEINQAAEPAETPAIDKPRRGRPPKSGATAAEKLPVRRGAAKKPSGVDALAKVRGVTDKV
ncbi:MucR family transcriptional regulator [Sphingomonas solaris]|uniref:MucR family transcriptional regulator n=1 Tax=Alterirhizorhabdus solaris TaxID=2529389 RepID=A0A558QX34_9SPHN|nr:MucR family transcriptional regulator [Sphingomonas solaris]